MNFYVAHELSHRVRFRAFSSFSNSLASTLGEQLGAIDGMREVKINARTGSVLILFDQIKAREESCVILKINKHQFAFKYKHCACTERQLATTKGALDWWMLGRALIFQPFLPMIVRAATAVISALPFLCNGLSSLLKGKLNVSVLDAAAIGISLLRRDFRTVKILTLLLNFGDMLESWTRKNSLDNLAQSLALTVDNVWVKRKGQEIRIGFDEILESDLIIVRAGSAIPVDGIINSGEASVNQASMTGEPYGILRSEGQTVFAGTVVEEGMILVQATHIGDETRLNKIIKYIETSEAIKAKIQGKTERLADRIVPYSFLLAGLVWFLTRDIARATTILLVDYSCALKLATPLAILNAMKEGVQNGVIVKGGVFLEQLASVDTIVFDKTGTLTNAKPRVVEVIPTSKYSREEVYRIAACLEEHFPHPVARAIVHGAEAENLQHIEEHTVVEYIVAHGIASYLHGRRVLLGSRHYIRHDENICVDVANGKIDELSNQGYSLLYLAMDEELIGIIAIEDPLRDEAIDVVNALRNRGMRIVMLTGDDERTAKTIAAKVGILEYSAQVLPTQKADAVKSLQEEGAIVLMLGDGINDSPALSAANVGVTMNDGSDLAKEVSDVVIVNCQLGDVLLALDLGKATMARINSNFRLIMGLNTGFLASGLFGILTPGILALLHNLTTLGVSLNAMRTLLPKNTGDNRND